MKVFAHLAIVTVVLALAVAAWNAIPAAWPWIRCIATIALAWAAALIFIISAIQGLHSDADRGSSQ